MCAIFCNSRVQFTQGEGGRNDRKKPVCISLSHHTGETLPVQARFNAFLRFLGNKKNKRTKNRPTHEPQKKHRRTHRHARRECGDLFVLLAQEAHPARLCRANSTASGGRLHSFPLSTFDYLPKYPTHLDFYSSSPRPHPSPAFSSRVSDSPTTYQAVVL